MLEVTVTLKGHRWSDIEFAMEVVMENLKKENLSGFGENETGSYAYDVKGEESTIDVYEDNAGNIFLHLEGTLVIYQDDPFVTNQTVDEDTQAIITGDTSNWSSDWVHRFPNKEVLEEMLSQQEMYLIATWHADERIEIWKNLCGSAGEKFLGIEEE